MATTSTPIPKAKLTEFRAAGTGFAEPEATERILTLVFHHFQRAGEITVVDETGKHDLLRIGEPHPPWHKGDKPSHNIKAVHAHESLLHTPTGVRYVPSGSAFEFSTSPDRQFYLDYLFAALEVESSESDTESLDLRLRELSTSRVRRMLAFTP